MIGGGGGEFSFMLVFYSRGMVSVSSLSYFSSIDSSSKPYHCYPPLSIRVHFIQEYLKNKMGEKRKYINP